MKRIGRLSAVILCFAMLFQLIAVEAVAQEIDAAFSQADGVVIYAGGGNSFDDHLGNDEYNTAAFDAVYPASLTDYDATAENICTVTFDPGTGGRALQGTYTIKKGKSFADSSLTLPYAAKANGILNGWYDDPVNGTKLENTTVITENKTYYAHWDSSVDNPINMTLTDIKGRNVSTKSEGIKTVLVFGCLTSCWNTKSTMAALCESEYINRKDVRVIFVQINQGTIKDVATNNNYGDNFYLCDYSQEYNRLSWQYIYSLLGSGVSTYTMPFIVAMNESNKCVFAGTYNVLSLQMVYDSISDPDEVIASGYCGGEGDGTNLSWTLTDDGTLTISGNGKMGDYNAYEFVPWYKHNNAIKSIKFIGNIASIGSYAFYWFEYITSVTIPNSVTSIGDYAFGNNRCLKSIEIPNSVTNIGSHAFIWCTSLISIEIPNSVTSIGSHAFYGCRSLTSIEIPNSVTNIDQFTFYDCKSLTSVTIPNSVKRIDCYAFVYCTGLTSIEIPSSVTSIGTAAFSWCTSLSKIQVDSANIAYCSVDGVLFSKNRTRLICYPAGKQSTSFVIPNSVTNIGDGAFIYCAGLTSIEIPSSVTSIGTMAFSDCQSLTSIVIPESVIYIGTKAFSSCTSMTDIYCKAQSKPSQWDENWISNCLATVHWGYKGGISDNIKADLDGDGEFGESDLIVVLNHIKGLSKLTNDQLKAADVNGDGSVDIRDYNLMFYALQFE